MLLVVVVGGDEDDRHVRGPAPVADQGRGFEPVHARHVDVEQNDGEIALEHLFQCLLAGFGGEKPPEILQDGLVDQKLVRAVIDDENVRPAVVLCPVLYAAGGRLEVPAAVDERRQAARKRNGVHVGLPDQPSQARSTPTISSASTGLDR